MDLYIQIETFNLSKAANFLGINQEVLRRKTASGEIPGVKIGKRWVFLNIDLVDWLKTQYPGSQQEPQGANDKEKNKSCHSKNVDTSGTFTSTRQTDEEYGKVLGLETERRPKSTTIG